MVTFWSAAASGSDLNRTSSNAPSLAPSAIAAALDSNSAAEASPSQYLRTTTCSHLAFLAYAAASRPSRIHVAVVTSSAAPRPTRPTCLNGNPAPTRVNAVWPDLPLNSHSVTRSWTSAARPGAMPSNVASSAASASASASQRDTTSASAPIASVAEDSAAVTSREANGRISPGAKPRPLAAYARTEERVGAVVGRGPPGTATRRRAPRRATSSRRRRTCRRRRGGGRGGERSRGEARRRGRGTCCGRLATRGFSASTARAGVTARGRGRDRPGKTTNGDRKVIRNAWQ